jgi:hypothetical protein
MGSQKAAAYAHARCLARYLARESEHGREATRMDDLLVQLRANSKLTEADLTTVENEASAGSVSPT